MTITICDLCKEPAGSLKLPGLKGEHRKVELDVCEKHWIEYEDFIRERWGIEPVPQETYGRKSKFYDQKF